MNPPKGVSANSKKCPGFGSLEGVCTRHANRNRFCHKCLDIEKNGAARHSVHSRLRRTRISRAPLIILRGRGHGHRVGAGIRVGAGSHGGAPGRHLHAPAVRGVLPPALPMVRPPCSTLHAESRPLTIFIHAAAARSPESSATERPRSTHSSPATPGAYPWCATRAAFAWRSCRRPETAAYGTPSNTHAATFATLFCISLTYCVVRCSCGSTRAVDPQFKCSSAGCGRAHCSTCAKEFPVERGEGEGFVCAVCSPVPFIRTVLSKELELFAAEGAEEVEDDSL